MRKLAAVTIALLAWTGAEAEVGAPRQQAIQEVIQLLSQGEFEKALARVDALERECAGSWSCEAEAWTWRGNAQYWKGALRDALASYDRALPLYQAVGDRRGEAVTLSSQGAAWAALGDDEQALSTFDRARVTWQAVGDGSGEAATLNNIGQIWSRRGEYLAAIQLYDEALSLSLGVDDRAGEAIALANLGTVWSRLGEKQKALSHYDQALALEQIVDDRRSEATLWNNIGWIHAQLGQEEAALLNFDQALELFRGLADLAGEGMVLHNSGLLLSKMGSKQEALERFERALLLERRTGYRAGEARTLNGMAKVWGDLDDREKALSCYEQALPLSRATGDREGEADALEYLARLVQHTSPARALLHAKQAVNVYQSLRGDIRGFDDETQRTYAQSVSSVYRFLAEMLVEQGRVLEAQAVLDLLKQDELNRLLRSGKPAGGSVSLDAAERAADEGYRARIDELNEVRARVAELEAKKGPTDAEKAELARQRTLAQSKLEELHAFLAGLDATLVRPESDRKQQARELVGIQTTLAALDPGTVAVYTIFGRDRTTLILFTRSAWVEKSVPLSGAEVSRRVFAMREAMSRPGTDPAPAATAMYEVLVAPIAADLEKAGAKTILWSLDGPLRYVPTAALRDPSGRWLVEGYRTAVITSAMSGGTRVQATAKKLRVLGAGVTKAHEGFQPLAAVDREVRAVVRDAGNPGGALPGKRLMDERFTKEAWLRELDGSWPVVHVSSHYVFSPHVGGSFLLLGDGSRLSLKELAEAKEPPFTKVDLLSLSACQTGAGADGSAELSGAEVDGLAMVAQRRGAGAVLATLWPVDDPATATMMADFYRRYGTGKVARAEALREAQLAMIHASKPGASGGANRGARNVADADARPRDSTHPYYWAPFILLGSGS
jgi:CHAT domain-containing protein/Tfp pilus assembly protein PilF